MDVCDVLEILQFPFFQGFLYYNKLNKFCRKIRGDELCAWATVAMIVWGLLSRNT